MLDGAVFAHTASTGAGDIRIYGLDANREFGWFFCALRVGLDDYTREDGIPRDDGTIEHSGGRKLRLDFCSNPGFSALDALLQN